jgi:hypothetical protein
MILPFIPGTVGCGHGIAADVALGFAAPGAAPPEVAVAVGVDAHAPGPCVGPLKLGSVVAVGAVWEVAPALAPPADGVAPPPVLALAPVAPTSANVAKPGSIR